MAEVIGLLSGIIAVANLASSLLSTAYDISRAARETQGLKKELENFHSSLKHVQKLLGEGEDKLGELDYIRRHKDRVLVTCKGTGASLERLLQALQKFGLSQHPQEDPTEGGHLDRLFDDSFHTIERCQDDTLRREPIVWRLGGWLNVGFCLTQQCRRLTRIVEMGIELSSY
jgi:hypothetical protein